MAAVKCKGTGCDAPAVMAMKVKESIRSPRPACWTIYPASERAPVGCFHYCAEHGAALARALMATFVTNWGQS